MRPVLAASHGQFFLPLWLTFVFSVCLLSDAHAQSMRQGLPQPSPPARAPQPTQSPNDADPATKLSQARAELESTTRLNAKADLPVGIAQSDVIERRATLERLIGVYTRQVQNADQLARAERQREAMEKQAREWRDVPAPSPPSVFVVDRLRISLQTATLQMASSEARQSIIAQEMEAARRELASAEETLRQIQERMEHRDSASPAGESLQWSRDMAQLRRRLAAATVTASDADAKVTGAEIAGYRAHAQLLRKQLAIASSRMRFTQADLDKVVADLGKQQTTLEQDLQRAQSRRDEVHHALEDAQSTLARAAAAQSSDVPRLADMAELRGIEARNSDLAVQLARLKVQARIQERSAWQYRMFLANSKEPGKLREANAGISDAMQRLAAWARYIDGEIALTTLQIDEQDRRVRAASSPGEIAHLGQVQKAFEQRSALYQDAKESLATHINTLTLWKQQFTEERAARTVRSTLSAAWERLRDAAYVVWNFELFNSDDTVEVDGRKITAKRSVTIGKSIGAVLVLVLGYFATLWLMRRAERQLVQRFHVEPTVGEILRRWGQFVMLAVLFVFALNLVKIPLTLFAFLGGALAIGVGFGAQNLLKNLMSGIILLIERPLRVGDIVEMGGTVGSVTDISIRASTVRNSNGIETLIPNSNFLENIVTNWTYSDRRVRRDIKVSVPRPESTRQIADLLLTTAQRHGQLLKDPAPRVLLQDLGIDTLTFTLQYWTELRTGVDGDVIASDLRFMIETALKDAAARSKPAEPEVSVSSPEPQKVT